MLDLQPMWEAQPHSSNNKQQPTEHPMSSNTNKLSEEVSFLCIYLVRWPILLNDEQREQSARRPQTANGHLESISSITKASR